MCRCCVNAIVKQSLKHDRDGKKLCLNCVHTVDSLGIVTGANHFNHNIEDWVQVLDGVSHNRKGLRSLIDDGAIDILDSGLVVGF